MATALSPEIKHFAEKLQIAYQKELKRAFDSEEANHLALPETAADRVQLLSAARQLGSNIPEYAVHAAVPLVAAFLVGDDAGATKDTQMTLPGFVQEESGKRRVEKVDPEPGTPEYEAKLKAEYEKADMEARREGDDPDAPENNPPKQTKRRVKKADFKAEKAAASGVSDTSIGAIQ
jgi:hypothetical protein